MPHVKEAGFKPPCKSGENVIKRKAKDVGSKKSINSTSDISSEKEKKPIPKKHAVSSCNDSDEESSATEIASKKLQKTAKDVASREAKNLPKKRRKAPGAEPRSLTDEEYDVIFTAALGRDLNSSDGEQTDNQDDFDAVLRVKEEALSGDEAVDNAVSQSDRLVDGDNDSLNGILALSPPSKQKKLAASEEKPLDEISNPKLELSEDPLKKKTRQEEEEQNKGTILQKVKKEKSKATKEGCVQKAKKERNAKSSKKEESEANKVSAKLSGEDTVNGHKALNPAAHKFSDRGERPQSKKEQIEGQREHKSKGNASKAKKGKCDLPSEQKEHGIVGKEGQAKREDAGGRPEKKMEIPSAEKKMKERLFKRKLEKQLFACRVDSLSKQKKTDESHTSKSPTHKKTSKDMMSNREVEQIGIWVQCSLAVCNKWRYLKDTHDPTKLSENWNCTMNTDPTQSACSATEAEFDPETEKEDFIYTKYAEGSLVWARMAGYPWWPGIVEMDPDYQTFFECRIEPNIASDYHVTFLDEKVTRAWFSNKSLRPFTGDSIGPTKIRGQDFTKVITEAKRRANNALKLPLPDRINQFGFASHFKGRWGILKGPDGFYESLPGCTEESQQEEGVAEDGADDVSGFSVLSGPEVDEILDDAESLIESAHEALNELLSQHSKDLDEYVSGVEPPKKKSKKVTSAKPSQKTKKERKEETRVNKVKQFALKRTPAQTDLTKTSKMVSSKVAKAAKAKYSVPPKKSKLARALQPADLSKSEQKSEKADRNLADRNLSQKSNNSEKENSKVLKETETRCSQPEVKSMPKTQPDMKEPAEPEPEVEETGEPEAAKNSNKLPGGSPVPAPRKEASKIRSAKKHKTKFSVPQVCKVTKSEPESMTKASSKKHQRDMEASTPDDLDLKRSDGIKEQKELDLDLEFPAPALKYESGSDFELDAEPAVVTSTINDLDLDINLDLSLRSSGVKGSAIGYANSDAESLDFEE